MCIHRPFSDDQLRGYAKEEEIRNVMEEIDSIRTQEAELARRRKHLEVELLRLYNDRPASMNDLKQEASMVATISVEKVNSPLKDIALTLTLTLIGRSNPLLKT